MIKFKETKAKPILASIYDLYKADLNLEKCYDKHLILDLLKKHKPKVVNKKKLDTRGAYYSFREICYFNYVIDGFNFKISSITGPLTGFYEFLEQIAYYDDKSIIRHFDDENSSMFITSIPVDKENIRITIFPYDFKREKRISKDIIVNKYSFIKQMRDEIFRCHIIAERDKEFIYLEGFIYDSIICIDILDKYLKNPEEFKKTHIIEKPIRIFDVAFKKPDSDWQNKIYFEDDEESNRNYWENLKQQGKIELYDFFEQTEPNYYVNTKTGKRVYYKNKKEIKYDNYFCKSERDNNGVYSKYTKKWYSKEEIMPMPPLTPIVLEDFNLDIQIDIDHCSNKWNSINQYLKNLKDAYRPYISDIDCIITIQDKSQTYTADFYYGRLAYRFLDRIKRGNTFRINKYYNKVHIWDISDGYFYIYYSEQNEKNKSRFFKIKKDEFIAKTEIALKKIDRQVNFFKTKYDLLKNEIDYFQFDDKNNFYILDEIKDNKTQNKLLKKLKFSKPKLSENAFVIDNNSFDFQIENYYMDKKNIKNLINFSNKIVAKNNTILWITKNGDEILNVFSIPVNNTDIRIFISDEKIVSQKYLNSDIKYDLKDSYVLADIIVNKKQFIKELNTQLKKIPNDCRKEVSHTFQNDIDFFDEFIHSSENFLIPDGSERYFKYDVMYKDIDGKWVLTTDYDKNDDGKNIRKVWTKKIKNGEICDFKVKHDIPFYSYFYTKKNKTEADKSDWFCDNWVYSYDTQSWYPKDTMPEITEQSVFYNTIKDIPLSYNYLKNIEDFKYILQKIIKGKDFHYSFINHYKESEINIFNVWHKDNDMLRIYIEIRNGWFESEIKNSFDINILKTTFINEFKQILKASDVVKT